MLPTARLVPAPAAWVVALAVFENVAMENGHALVRFGTAHIKTQVAVAGDNVIELAALARSAVALCRF
jgi:hypothetical protein